ncbi:AzlD domain-containing protein [Terrilactibacillus sp. S3-3]|nr:AzlD domain-containing protein [Terrilactibacillus sp. S3-3]
MLNNWLLIGLVSVTTYLSRIAGVQVVAGRKLNAGMRLYFNFVPIAIISALLIKQIFIPVQSHLAVSYPVLIGCLATTITITRFKMFLPSVAIGIFAGWLTRYFFMS